MYLSLSPNFHLHLPNPNAIYASYPFSASLYLSLPPKTSSLPHLHPKQPYTLAFPEKSLLTSPLLHQPYCHPLSPGFIRGVYTIGLGFFQWCRCGCLLGHNSLNSPLVSQTERLSPRVHLSMCGHRKCAPEGHWSRFADHVATCPYTWLQVGFPAMLCERGWFWSVHHAILWRVSVSCCFWALLYHQAG